MVSLRKTFLRMDSTHALRTARSRIGQVLLVDDNPTNLAVLYEALEAQGCELLIAQSGEEALEIAAEARPALVLLISICQG